MTETAIAAPPRRGRALLQLGIVVVAAILLDVATHDFAYLLSWPLWGDEAWVVAAQLFPISDTPLLTSSEPVGWNVMVQGMAFLGDKGGRVLVQGFTVAGIVAAYYVGRDLFANRGRRFAIVSGGVVALGLALAPATLLRLDIKHYTADVFVTMLLLWLVVRWMQERRLRWIVAIAVTTALGLFIALATVFAGVAAFAAILLDALIRRRWRELGPIVIGAVVGAIGLVVLYAAFYTVGDNDALRGFWKGYEPSLTQLPSFLGWALITNDKESLFGEVAVILPLVTFGTVLMYLRKQWAVASFAPLTLILMCAAAVAKRYPLLDARTSEFFFMLASVLSAISMIVIVDWVAGLVAKRWRRTGTWLRWCATGAAGLLIVAVSIPNWQAHSLPDFSTEAQVDYIDAHWQPGDLVVYNQLAGYQLAFDWDKDEPTWCADEHAWIGWDICYPEATDIKPFWPVDAAYAMIQEHLEEYPGSRVWVVRSHSYPDYWTLTAGLNALFDFQDISLPIQNVGLVTGVKAP